MKGFFSLCLVVCALFTAFSQEIITGAQNTASYIDWIKGKKIALVVNPTSMVGDEHLVDFLLQNKITILKIFGPEHGFRGVASAGEKVNDSKDEKTGIDVISLYGNKKGPSEEDLKGIDLLIFDIQDVGVRFYTYISTLHYVLESCAKFNVPVLILDRPNPNGHFVDGPILQPGFESFVGMHPIPVAHGMTIGEYALMVNGEGWLGNGLKAALKVIPCLNYDHNLRYTLPVKPSPNLPDMKSIYLYPSTCFFEGTTASEGRGTPFPFQVFGHPDYPDKTFGFTPIANDGAKNPKQEGITCFGKNLTTFTVQELAQLSKIDISYLIDFYTQFPDKSKFFLANGFFDKLAGGKTLREQIEKGWSEVEIRKTWVADIEKFKKVRSKYLLYKDF
jgi:uncharacterized protein YbbC (DUF1343 family)